MAFYHDHYKSHRADAPLPKYLHRTLKIFFIFIFIVLSFGGAKSKQTTTPITRLSIDQQTLTKNQLTPLNLREKKPQFLLFKNQVMYLNNQLNLIHNKNFDKETLFSANHTGYVTYKKVGKKISAFNFQGKQLFTTKSPSYPRMARSGKYIFLFTGDQSGIKFISSKGIKNKHFTLFPTLITDYCYSPRNKAAYLGLLDGTLEKIALPSQKNIWREQITKSQINIIKGIGLSPNEQTIGVLSGHHPERFSLHSASGNKIWSTKTEGTRKNKTRIFVGKKYCFGHSDNFVYLLKKSSGSKLYATAIPNSAGTILWADFADSSQNEVVAMSYSYGKTTTVTLLDRDMHLILHKTLNSRYAFVSLLKNGTILSIQTEQGIQFHRINNPQ